MQTRALVRLAATVAVAVFASETGYAQESDYARPGPYVALTGVASIPVSDLSRDHTGVGVAVRGGYRAGDRLALEGQVEYSGDRGFADESLTLLTANAKLLLGESRVQPYLLVGLGAAFVASDLRRDGVHFAFRAGAGVDAYLTPRVGVLLEAAYVRPSGAGAAFDAMSIGWGVFYRW
jgi:opacity protein-like surface antigen